MIAMELFENIMSRTNTVFPEAQKTGVDNKNLIAANNFGNTFRKIAILIVTLSMLLCLCQLPTTTSAASIHKRDTVSATNNISSGTKYCHQYTPCGWAIYIPFTRRIDEFVKNACECPSSMVCFKDNDEISTHVYVYRCRVRPLSTNTKEPSSTTPYRR